MMGGQDWRKGRKEGRRKETERGKKEEGRRSYFFLRCPPHFILFFREREREYAQAVRERLLSRLHAQH